MKREPLKNKALQALFFVKEKGIATMPKIRKYISRNFILLCAVLLALISCFFVPFDRKYLSYIDYKTIACLLSLVLITRGMYEIKLFKIMAMKILEKIKSVRVLCLFIVFLPSLLAIFITNDVAVLTFAPFAMVLLKLADKTKLIPKVMILQILACNISGMLSPIGTAQNLYLYEFYELSPLYFFQNLYPIAAVGYAIVFLLAISAPKETILPVTMSKRTLPVKGIIVYTILFALTLLAVFKIVPYYIILAIVVATILIMDRHVFVKANYNIIFMFVAFFIFVGNITRINAVNAIFERIIVGNEYLLAIGLSQLISNTPTALLLPQFTSNYYPLILGLGVGKFGSLIASMSNFMAYSMYSVKYKSNSRRFLAQLLAYNLAFVIILGGLGALLIYL